MKKIFLIIIIGSIFILSGCDGYSLQNLLGKKPEKNNQDLLTNENNTRKESMDYAEEALIKYFSLLDEEKFNEATQYYGGNYETLRGFNSSVDPDDYSELFLKACRYSGLNCLKVKNIVDKKAISPTEFEFSIQFLNRDGNVFELGPCCGEIENTEKLPVQTDFTFKVKKIGNKFVVMDLPVYTP